VCWQIEYFINYERLKEVVIFVLSDCRKVSAEGIGQIRIHLHVDGKEHYFQNVMFVPKSQSILGSISCRKGIRADYCR